ncbi:MAG TPA: type IV toxin-antitoxin system AbiEi family antitoxin domain-containing protein [Solirubrobacterales bacterium]|nr:type IV toxin-antitoxin system AbiEi family antitoxin domain-containing protein [Solirubrobacterales bacterium]
MAGSTHAARSAAAWRLARAQHWVLTRADLEALGFSDAAVEHRVAIGRLHPVARGIYAVGRAELAPQGKWMAAVLACGDGAVLSHRSAAELWGIGYEEKGRIDVTIRRRSRLERAGVRVHCRPKLPERSVVRRLGLPATHPVQTLIDLATELKPLRLERAVNQADVHDLVDPETLRTALDGFVGMPGVKTLRTLLDRHTFRLSDSDLEVLFRPLARAAALPSPLSKHWVLGYEVDFWFPDHGLVVETDGLRYHRTPAQQARMVKRDQTHTAAGLRVLRFTHWQIAYASTEVTDVLRRIRPHLRAIPAAVTASPGRGRDRPVPTAP